MDSASLASEIQLHLPGGVKIRTPDSLENLTSYIIREQGDYFEDEIRFVRTLMRRGETAIDIGANYGVYALTIASCVGPSGHVFAFEPDRETASYLKKSIAANGFAHIALREAAVSDNSEGANLIVGKHSELNNLTFDNLDAPKTQRVNSTTLDGILHDTNWPRVDFVKMDAEGSELRILRGASRFFSTFSPLVQFEIRTDSSSICWELIDRFHACGYSSYRLVPGLSALRPFDRRTSPDPYLLNLFCCKPDKAKELAERQLLIESASATYHASDAGDVRNTASDAWIGYLDNLPYSTAFRDLWTPNRHRPASPMEAMLELYVTSHDCKLSARERLYCLESCYTHIRQACDQDPRGLRLATFARVASEYGERSVAIGAARQLLSRIQQAGIDFSEPFLSPLEHFDGVAPNPSPESWLIASILEFLERNESFSSFYTGPSALERLVDIAGLGLGSTEMARRLDLVRRRLATRP